jgi:hypothetical protein
MSPLRQVERYHRLSSAAKLMISIENIASKAIFSSQEDVGPIRMEKYRARRVYHLQQPAITATVGMQFGREKPFWNSRLHSPPPWANGFRNWRQNQDREEARSPLEGAIDKHLAHGSMSMSLLVNGFPMFAAGSRESRSRSRLHHCKFSAR